MEANSAKRSVFYIVPLCFSDRKKNDPKNLFTQLDESLQSQFKFQVSIKLHL